MPLTLSLNPEDERVCRIPTGGLRRADRNMSPEDDGGGLALFGEAGFQALQIFAIAGGELAAVDIRTQTRQFIAALLRQAGAGQQAIDQGIILADGRRRAIERGPTVVRLAIGRLAIGLTAVGR